ncbi:tRNA synthetases class I (M)-domain-containing protein [Halteromyces radiatus]|uniref:tRNA synthetases class I (M)-domain-containing protein n=1 Tax=Halteromyces radiatus TaxID=101107 RepID=UPI0022206CAF|nr:tRNA synthetases class I (M)-domain-containing protein [Halteromyces radiatus]KAI8093160.1 tRNA synthetases class I (M)-domain-containing protein [Halteromyces radiatus]
MVRPLNVTVPKLVPSQRHYANFLKLLIAAEIASVKINQIPGDTLTVLFDDITIHDPNVAVRYILDATTFNLETNFAIEKESTVFGPLINKKKYDSTLKDINQFMEQYDIFTHSDKLTAVDAIYYGSLYETLSDIEAAKYPKVAAWAHLASQTSAVKAALDILGQQIQTKAPKRKHQTTEKKTVEVSPLGDLNPATQKLNDQVVFKPLPEGQKVTPVEGERNILITSALPYVNNIPHLGNIVGSTLSADVYARYCRLRGYNTLYICGTDEYGTATETKALEEGVSCQALCDKYNAVHTSVYKWFDLSFDKFGRTTTEKQTQITQDIFKKVNDNGYVIQDSMTQLFCEQCQRFLADRYVEGICPNCQYVDARGDQCDACGRLLNATELIQPRCKLDGNSPVTKDSRHLFLDLGKLQDGIEEFNNRSNVEGKWSANGINITGSWLKEGLRPRCITRDLKWGTSVPLEGFENKVFYVWFDACIGYPSITANYTDDWEKWWKNPKNVHLYQFMGKDNVPFHSVIFPGTQLATKEDWTMVHHISTTEYLNYEGGKFSKSRNVGVFGTNAEETGIPPSVWRYYLLSGRPETNDSMFTWNEFITKNNAELLNNLGNFVNRAIKFVLAKYDGVLPAATETPLNGELEVKLVKDVNELLAQYVDQLEQVKLRAGLATAMAISARGNQYLQESNLSNGLYNDQRPQCNAVVTTALNLIYILSSLIYPYMPATSDSISRQINAPLRTIPDTFSYDLHGGHKLNGAEYLFTRIDEKMEQVWKAKYGGSKNDEGK